MNNTSDWMQALADAIRRAKPDLDVRTDQSEMIRVYRGLRAIGIVRRGAFLTAKCVSLEGQDVFDNKLLSVMETDSMDELLRYVIEQFRAEM